MLERLQTLQKNNSWLFRLDLGRVLASDTGVSNVSLWEQNDLRRVLAGAAFCKSTGKPIPPQVSRNAWVFGEARMGRSVRLRKMNDGQTWWIHLPCLRQRPSLDPLSTAAQGRREPRPLPIHKMSGPTKNGTATRGNDLVQRKRSVVGFLCPEAPSFC